MKSKVQKEFCKAFLKCKNRATTTIHNVILGEVPACKRCKKILDNSKEKD
jgi:hypothetical protein